MRTLSILLGAVLFAAPAQAATPDPLRGRDADKPISIDAAKNETDIKAKITTFSGDVRITQGDTRMRADRVKHDQPNNKIYFIGKVVVDAPSTGTITGDNGIYDMTKKLVTLSGHVVLHKQGQITGSGSLLTYNMATGQATLGAAPVAATADQAAAPGEPGGRVHAVIIPKSAQTGGQ
jgi:lipopolysaccharide export system protein LptA